MSKSLRINFVLPPVTTISGGPLAILEYANRFAERGHKVSITTSSDDTWSGDSPFPWFKFNGTLHYKKLRHGSEATSSVSAELLRVIGRNDTKALSSSLLANFGVAGLREVILHSCSQPSKAKSFEFLVNETLNWVNTIDAIPECDLNIATFWSTVFPVYLSGKGKPVYFMQHYEEVFYPLEPVWLMPRMLARTSYELPVYKVANSSWLQKQIENRFGQHVPFSNNAIEISDFSPQPKKSEQDGILRVFTYARPEEWKGFSDAVAAMAGIRKQYGPRVEWNVFGYRHPSLTEDNQFAPYTYHPKLSFAELGRLYATSDIALCPSWYESFPLPPLEAMASGTAVVTTRAGTEDYAFHERNALVIGSRNTGEMFTAVERLLKDKELRNVLARNGRETAETFTWDAAVKKREQILFAIHEGETTYDIFKAAKSGLRDVNNIEFESAPLDLDGTATGLFWYQGQHLFLLHEGVKRQISDKNVIPSLLKHKLRYLEIDSLSFVRTPTGSPITTAADVPLFKATQ